MISYTLWFSSHWTEQNFAKLPKIILLYSTNATMEYHTLPCNSTQCISLSQESFVVSTAWTLSGKWCRHVTRLLGSQQLWRPMHCNGPTNANGPIHLTHTQIQTSISSSFLPLLTQFRLLLISSLVQYRLLKNASFVQIWCSEDISNAQQFQVCKNSFRCKKAWAVHNWWHLKAETSISRRTDRWGVQWF